MFSSCKYLSFNYSQKSTGILQDNLFVKQNTSGAVARKFCLLATAPRFFCKFNRAVVRKFVSLATAFLLSRGIFFCIKFFVQGCYEINCFGRLRYAVILKCGLRYL